MKTLKTFGIVLIAAIIIPACSGSGNVENKMKTTLPTELSDNQKVKDYFETLELVIDEYVVMIENIVTTGRNAERNGEEPSISDAFSMLSDVTTSAMKMEPLLEKMDQLEEDAEVLQQEMSQDEVEAFSKTYLKIMERFYEMGKKLEENK